jgi:ribosome-binding ATPase YchF (GTP1/OBG family)
MDPLADMLGAIAAEADWLAKGDDARFMNDVALRMQTRIKWDFAAELSDCPTSQIHPVQRASPRRQPRRPPITHFCTIEPNVGRVAVPDPRLDRSPRSPSRPTMIETQLEFVDIAGLVRGASKGEGLGNQFLANIREVDAIVHVLRCFEGGDVTHVEGRVDAVADAETVETELMLADLESLEKRVPNLVKKGQQGDKEAKVQASVLGQALDLLRDSKPVRLTQPRDEEEKQALERAQLLTAKPVLYVCNVDEADAAAGNAQSAAVFAKAEAEGAGAVIISAAIEPRSRPWPAEDRAEFLKDLGSRRPPRPHHPRRLRPARPHHLLHRRPQGSARLDVEKGCEGAAGRGRDPHRLRARLHPRRDDRLRRLRRLRRRKRRREPGRLRSEGKDYVVQDGDVLLFRFNVWKPSAACAGSVPAAGVRWRSTVSAQSCRAAGCNSPGCGARAIRRQSVALDAAIAATRAVPSVPWPV